MCCLKHSASDRIRRGVLIACLATAARVSDAGLEHLAGMTDLKVLGLGGTKITDAGLVHLAVLTNLQYLKLHGTRVTADGLVHLRSMTKLQWLSLGGNQISDAGLAGLRQALPNCEVENSPPRVKNDEPLK